MCLFGAADDLLKRDALGVEAAHYICMRTIQNTRALKIPEPDDDFITSCYLHAVCILYVFFSSHLASRTVRAHQNFLTRLLTVPSENYNEFEVGYDRTARTVAIMGCCPLGSRAPNDGGSSAKVR